MTEILTAAQMRAIEKAAIDSGEVTGLELMERAGVGVVKAILEEWPAMALTSHKAVVLCGPGNNGGDGFVVARLLKARGWGVEVFLYGDAEKLPVDAKLNYARWLEVGRILDADSPSIFDTADLYVDALFGTGLTRPITGIIANTISSLQKYSDKTVSVDLPSGYCSDSGRKLGPTINCRLCVTFERPRVGHKAGEAYLGIDKLSVAKIGLSKHVTGYFQENAHDSLVRLTKRSEYLGKGEAGAGAHKFSYGHAFVLSGRAGKSGAARLAARGALRVGAGVVTVACPPEALAENAAQLNSIMLKRVSDATALSAVLQDARINALCLGPALGFGQDQAALVAAALTVRGDRTPYGSRKVVLDADALTLLSRDAELFGMLHEDCVLTPHAGEFARLFPDIAAKLAEPAIVGPAYSKVDATRDAAKRAGCVVLYKGADTVIADASGCAAISSAQYERAAPWLATAGSGDVLAGFITGLLARGFTPMQAAQTGAWLHVECALKFGAGLIAEDIAEQLPKVFSDLGL